jgi:cation transport ATPase
MNIKAYFVWGFGILAVITFFLPFITNDWQPLFPLAAFSRSLTDFKNMMVIAIPLSTFCGLISYAANKMLD